ncbi:hypothetical protein VTI74DRAFT_2667 [Chaetomium olivicolor]
MNQPPHRAHTSTSLTPAEMDLRGYGLPTGYPPYRQDRPGFTELDSRLRYKYDRDPFLCNISLSDDTADSMPRWSTSTKKDSPRGKSNGSGLDDKRHVLKKSLATPRNQNPGIDVALRNLNHEVTTALRMYQAFLQSFETQVQSLQSWAEDYTLDTIWRNMVRDRVRDKRHKEKFESVAGRLLASRASVKNATRTAKDIKEAWDDLYAIERQIRTAKKAALFCDGIINLAERAASERLACKQLVAELEEARCLLERRKHPWICKWKTRPGKGLGTCPENRGQIIETARQMAKSIPSKKTARERRQKALPDTTTKPSKAM